MSNSSSAWQLLKAGNQHFYANVQGKHNSAANGRPPVAVVFRSADSDMASELIFGQPWGSLIDISNFGHVIDSGVLATLDYAVGTLKTPLIVVLGHSDSIAMQTALDAWNTAEFPEGASRAVVEQAISSLARKDGGIKNADDLSAAHVAHVGVSLLHKSPAVARAVDRGECAIVCAVIDREDGRLRVCGTIGDIADSQTPLLELV
jgi:carbonic anhydrase